MREGLAEVSVLVFVQAVGFCVKLLDSQTFSFAVASYGTQEFALLQVAHVCSSGGVDASSSDGQNFELQRVTFCMAVCVCPALS